MCLAAQIANSKCGIIQYYMMPRLELTICAARHMPGCSLFRAHRLLCAPTASYYRHVRSRQTNEIHSLTSGSYLIREYGAHEHQNYCDDVTDVRNLATMIIVTQHQKTKLNKIANIFILLN